MDAVCYVHIVVEYDLILDIIIMSIEYTMINSN